MQTQATTWSTLFPLPRQVSVLPGRWRVPQRPWSVFMQTNDQRIAEALRRTGVPFRQVADARFATLRLIQDKTDQHLRKTDAAVCHEAYHMQVGPKGIAIVARESAGLFYGLQTLQQLLQFQDTVPCMAITDWPALAFRGYHLTLGNGHMPNPATFRQLISRLGGLKINHLVIEYDDRFPWQKHPLIPHPDAYSPDELAGFVRLATANFIDIIPLIDSLGHAGPYLAHKRYAHLAEGAGNRNELCPDNPGTLAFIKDLWREVLAVHRLARYAHITGDETMGRGTTCARCRGGGMRGVARHYTKYYTDLSRWILEQGKKPMMWADMLIKLPDALHSFPRDVVMCDWHYEGPDKPDWRQDDVVWRYAPDGSLSQDRQRLFGRYWQTRPGTNRWSAFPYTRFLQDQGFPVIGCTASSDFGQLPISSMRARFWNNKWFALTLQARQAMGLLCTHWSGHVAMDAAWHAIYAAADCAWHPRRESTERFITRFGQRVLALPDGQARRLVAWDKHADARDGFLPAMWPQDRQAALISRRVAATVGGRRACVYADILRWSAAWHSQRQAVGALFNRIDRLLIGRGEHAPIDLVPNANCAIADCMPKGAFSLPIPAGAQKLYGVPFLVQDDRRTNGRSALITRGACKPEGARCINGIALGCVAQKLFFLYTAYDACKGCHVADIVAHYRDGRRAIIPVIEGVNITDWGKGCGLKTQAVTVFRGNARYVYMSWWANPRPGVALRTLDIVAADSQAYLILLAVTARTSSRGRIDPGAIRVMRPELRRLAIVQNDYARQLRVIYRRIMSPRDVADAAELVTQNTRKWFALYAAKLDRL